jgi:hypothetical protein
VRLRHLLQGVAQRVQLDATGLRRGQLGVCVAFLGDQLAAHFRRAPPCVQATAAELRVRLALAIHDGPDILEQVRQGHLDRLAPPQPDGLDTADAAAPFMQPLADRPPIPPQLALCAALAAGSQFAHRARHEAPTCTPTPLLRRLNAQGLY